LFHIWRLRTVNRKLTIIILLIEFIAIMYRLQTRLIELKKYWQI